MNHLETELQELRQTTVQMWNLVISQIKKTRMALQQFDSDIAREVNATEKRVNAMELKIDQDCENIIALFNPVAIDLRFVLAILKINNNLERTGDIAQGIAKLVIQSNAASEPNLVAQSEIYRMMDESIEMLESLLKSFEQEDSQLARTIFARDEILDVINRNANEKIAEYIRQNPENIEQSLNCLSSIRKLERVGDQCKNIAEEIIFYLEAKVLKHLKKKYKINPE